MTAGGGIGIDQRNGKERDLPLLRIYFMANWDDYVSGNKVRTSQEKIIALVGIFLPAESNGNLHNLVSCGLAISLAQSRNTGFSSFSD